MFIHVNKLDLSENRYYEYNISELITYQHKIPIK